MLDDVRAFLSGRGYRHAVAGGVALAAYGHPRLTLDLDIPERTWQELVDIGYLLTLPGVARDEARQYFEKANLLERWRELEQRP